MYSDRFQVPIKSKEQKGFSSFPAIYPILCLGSEYLLPAQLFSIYLDAPDPSLANNSAQLC